jgi:hypothetical protein
MNEKNKYTNDIIETIDTIDINDIQNLSSIIIFPEQKTSFRYSKRENFPVGEKNKYRESSSPKSISLELSSDKSINSRTPSSSVSENKDDQKLYKRIRYTNSNSNSPKSVSRNSPKIGNGRSLSDNNILEGKSIFNRSISQEYNENGEKQLLRILKNHNTTTKKSINLRK